MRSASSWIRSPMSTPGHYPSAPTIGAISFTVRRMSSSLAVRPLTPETWPAFAELVEANNGVWGGCWCIGFHVKLGKGRTPAQNRAEKEELVRERRTHAALVFDGDRCLGWCQFGSPEELPEIKSRRLYEKNLDVL